MRSDYTKQLFLAFAQGDKEKFLDIAHEIIKDEERKNHNYIAKQLKDIVKEISSGKVLNECLINKRYKNSIPIPRDTEKGFPLLEIKEFFLDWSDLIVNEDTEYSLKNIVDEIKQSEILSSYGLKPKQKILLCGAPGTGKTLSCKIISSILGYPLVHIKFESIVSSFLGETASNLKKVFDFIENGQWVVLFDEFDVIGKLRDDPHEHGEIKRVVNNFMQMLDNYKGESLLIAATNHQHLIDPGLWRRFDDILLFENPSKKERIEILKKNLRNFNKEKDLNFDELSIQINDYSAAEIERICLEAQKRNILTGKEFLSNEDINWAITRSGKRKAVEGK